MTRRITPTDTVFQVLAKEHRELEGRFAALFERAALDLEGAREDYRELAAELVAHLRAEGGVVFPALARIPAVEHILDGSRAAHAHLEVAAMALDRSNLTASEWLRALRRLHLDLVHLIEREESHVFPAARRAMPPGEAHLLAHALRLAESHELARGFRRTR